MSRPGTRELAQVVVERECSLFNADAERVRDQLDARFDGADVLVVGGAGSIGSATTQELLKLRPRSVCVVDVNENSLAELLRDIRSRDAIHAGTTLCAVPLDVGAPTMERVLGEYGPFQVVLNFAAVKHVRSERDVASLLHMLDVNVNKAERLIRQVKAIAPEASYFAVSTDKAANPVNLMGCSKRVMELAMFRAGSTVGPVTSARFANVAFSDGSLLDGWLRRIDKHQPLAVPAATRRYFVTPEESAQLCLLGAGVAPDRHVVYPALEPGTALQELDVVAERVMRAVGLEPLVVTSEPEARAAMTAVGSGGPYPLLVTKLDTVGEKPYEEFVADDDVDVDLGLSAVRALRPPAGDPGQLDEFLDWLRTVLADATVPVIKDEILQRLSSVVPELSHRASERSLDDRM